MADEELHFEALGSHRDYGDINSFSYVISKAFQVAKSRNRPSSIVNVKIDDEAKFETSVVFKNESDFEIEIFERYEDQSKELQFYGFLRLIE